ncbi:hypothetical protein PIB30_098597, partial [Stylosanthes scabra]|nr:hypothetical protein [Stylosanthes scabra]
LGEQEKLTAVTFGPRFKRGPNVTNQNLTSPAVTFGPHLKPGPNVTSPHLSQSSLKQTWNKLDRASTSSKSQAKLTLQAPKFDPRFWGSKNVTSSLATPRSRLGHVSNVTLQTPMQASQALPSFKQGHV